VVSWSREEVEATVSDYLEMLRAELTGEVYNKAEHNRRLLRLLRNRTRGAVERKHQNISAILHEMGLPSIDGYKPLPNYQGLLRDVVVDRVAARPDLIRLVAAAVERPAEVPVVGDLLASLENPPSRRAGPHRTGEHPWSRRKAIAGAGIDYLEREARNRSLGEAGELFVIRFEQERLERGGQSRLASRVEHVARTRGPGEGFDVLSFETTGQERLIEVKTTRYGKETPFYISRNEVAVSATRTDEYPLYRVFQFGPAPRLFQLAGSISESCRLTASQYVARVV
jgi:hypothetical protein